MYGAWAHLNLFSPLRHLLGPPLTVTRYALPSVPFIPIPSCEFSLSVFVPWLQTSHPPFYPLAPTQMAPALERWALMGKAAAAGVPLRCWRPCVEGWGQEHGVGSIRTRAKVRRQGALAWEHQSVRSHWDDWM